MIATQTAPPDAYQYTLSLTSLLHTYSFAWKNTTLKSYSYRQAIHPDIMIHVFDPSRIVRNSEVDIVRQERSLEKTLQQDLPNEGMSQPVFSMSLGVVGAYLNRIQSLEKACSEEGIVLNGASIIDFWTFVATTSFTRKATLVLSDNGDISAIWENEEDDYLDIQFLGNQEVVYVIFKRKTGENRMFRTAGTSSFGAIRDKVAELELMELVNE